MKTTQSKENMKRERLMFRGTSLLRSFFQYLFVVFISMILFIGYKLTDEASPFESWVILLVMVIGMFWIGRAIIYRFNWKSALPSLIVFVGFLTEQIKLVGYSMIVMGGLVVFLLLDFVGWIDPIYNYFDKRREHKRHRK